jgi:hypothetical protein
LAHSGSIWRGFNVLHIFGELATIPTEVLRAQVAQRRACLLTNAPWATVLPLCGGADGRRRIGGGGAYGSVG